MPRTSISTLPLVSRIAFPDGLSTPALASNCPALSSGRIGVVSTALNVSSHTSGPVSSTTPGSTLSDVTVHP